MPQIIPAILTNNPEDYKNKISILEKLVSRVQIDIIDGVFAKNKTVTANDIASIKTPLFLEAHLMVSNPEKYLRDCAQANVKLITVHIEPCKDNIDNILDKIHSLGIKAGIAINPETPIEQIQNFIDKIDLVLIMSVHPGFDGQKFIPVTLEKIKTTRKLFPNTKIEVDGGINLENIKKISLSGANYLIVNSGLFKNGINESAIKESLEKLKQEIADLKINSL